MSNNNLLAGVPQAELDVWAQGANRLLDAALRELAQLNLGLARDRLEQLRDALPPTVDPYGYTDWRGFPAK